MGKIEDELNVLGTKVRDRGLTLMFWHSDAQRLTIVNANGPTTLYVSLRTKKLLDDFVEESHGMIPDARRA